MCHFLSGHYVLKTQGSIKKGDIILPKNLMNHERSMQDHGLQTDTAVPWEYIKGKLDVRFNGLDLTDDEKNVVTFEIEYYLKNTIRKVIPKYHEWLGIWRSFTGEKLVPGKNVKSNGLTYLYLSNNQLREFSGDFPSLINLYLRNNQLREFSGDFPSLINLYLRNNQLREFSGDFPSLTTLYLGNNQLREFNGDFSSLINLDLSNNQLSESKIIKIREQFPNCNVYA